MQRKEAIMESDDLTDKLMLFCIYYIKSFNAKGFLSKQMIEKINNYKENDEDYWNWMYRGLVIGMGDNIYNLNHFQPL